MTTQYPFVRELYDAFQLSEFDRWDVLVAEDVLVNSTMGRDIHGRQALKEWAAQFVSALQSRVDLVDEFEAIDAAGNGRAFFTICLDWKHAEVFMGMQPTGREGTSIETMLLTIKDGKVVRWDVADNTVEINIYFWERGWAIPHNVHPEVLVKGIERRPSQV
ncbi:ester cyclase [Leptolyngbya sp. FACHB-541]|uniref:ester cyclase n=1 Tax=Leptolyngbya sp. FACHB-541 TaxID=2692810 RepID=UPI00168371AF|nr:ester cyclase [Leptolyngbya sp. FACHB-541]MBD2000558.1 ester cyclase [Leptolyngbya sp. FACHB-541]